MVLVSRQSCVKVLPKLPRNENGKIDFQSLKVAFVFGTGGFGAPVVVNSLVHWGWGCRFAHVGKKTSYD